MVGLKINLLFTFLNNNIFIILHMTIILVWVSNRNSVARNCAKLHLTILEMRVTMRSCAQFVEVYRARDCAQVKSTCVGNLNFGI